MRKVDTPQYGFDPVGVPHGDLHGWQEKPETVIAVQCSLS